VGLPPRPARLFPQARSCCYEAYVLPASFDGFPHLPPWSPGPIQFGTGMAGAASFSVDITHASAWLPVAAACRQGAEAFRAQGLTSREVVNRL